jgi:hypothetical protein
VAVDGIVARASKSAIDSCAFRCMTGEVEVVMAVGGRREECLESCWGVPSVRNGGVVDEVIVTRKAKKGLEVSRRVYKR